MIGRVAITAALILCAGCFSSSVQPPKAWAVSPTDAKPPAVPASGAFSVTRQGAVTVTAPFDSTSFVVRRADGSGRFGRVVPQSSSASADVQVEVLVRDLSLDCTAPERRTSRAAVSIDVLRADRGARTVILSGDGDGTGDVKDGNYSTAFSQAFDAALVGALRNLKEQPPVKPLETIPKKKGENK